MTLEAIVGFEFGDNRETRPASGTHSFQNSVVKNGSYALRVNPTTTGVGQIEIRGKLANGTPNFNINAPHIYFGFWFRYATKPSANSEELMQVQSNGNFMIFSIRLDSAGKLSAWDNGVSQVGSTGTTVLNVDTWYHINGHASNGAWGIEINDSVEISGSDALGGFNAASIHMGKVINRNGETIDFFYDDAYMDDAQNYDSTGIMVLLVPVGAGNYTAFLGGTNASNFLEVDDIPPDSGTRIESQSSSEAATFAMTPTATAGISGTIRAVLPYTMTQRIGGADANFSMRLRENSVDTDTTGTTGSFYVSYGIVHVVKPSDSNAWTPAEIDAAEVGVVQNSGVNFTRTTVVYLYVWYSPSVAVTEIKALFQGVVF